MDSSGQQKYEHFRKEYPTFTYEGFESILDAEGLKVVYHFNLSDRYLFKPAFTLPSKPFLKKSFSSGFHESEQVRNLLFQIGMIELVSYWKASCSPRVIIKAGVLREEQLSFWKKIYYNGLGEFFYTNGIVPDPEDFMRIESSGPVFTPRPFHTDQSVLVPIGGGKDSIVTLEILRKEMDVRPFILNPRGASLDSCFKAGFSNNQIAEIHRRLDPQLLRLNEQGFLNGHTPFSALLAFYTLLVAAFTQTRNIALSNESSANEPTVAGTNVNHQYSKSYEFEHDFRRYQSSFISGDFNYFSFLRPLSEIQIGMLFARNVKYYPVFKSCNVGSKTDSWCGSCPKCLFAWTILSPFIPRIEMEHIFGKNLFEDAGLIRYLKELTGIDEVKPFECVGTIDEVNAALHMYIHQHSKEKWPVLIDYFSNTSNFSEDAVQDAYAMLQAFNDQHYLEPAFLALLKSALA